MNESAFDQWDAPNHRGVHPDPALHRDPATCSPRPGAAPYP